MQLSKALELARGCVNSMHYNLIRRGNPKPLLGWVSLAFLSPIPAGLLICY